MEVIMKTIKLSVVAAVVALMMVGVVNAQEIKERPKFRVSVSMSLSAAVNDPGLMKAIYQQVSMEQVIKAHLHVFTAIVHYNGKVYRITGTFDQWMDFFLRDGRPVQKVRPKSTL